MVSLTPRAVQSGSPTPSCSGGRQTSGDGDGAVACRDADLGPSFRLHCVVLLRSCRPTAGERRGEEEAGGGEDEGGGGARGERRKAH